jgi:hypothetical protein
MAANPTNPDNEAELNSLLTWVASCLSYQLSTDERNIIAPLFRKYLLEGYDNARAFKQSMKDAQEELNALKKQR